MGSARIGKKLAASGAAGLLCALVALALVLAPSAGATDAGLWLTKEMRVLDTVLHPGRVVALQGIEEAGDELVIGAATSLSDAAPALGALHEPPTPGIRGGVTDRSEYLLIVRRRKDAPREAEGRLD